MYYVIFLNSTLRVFADTDDKKASDFFLKSVMHILDGTDVKKTYDVSKFKLVSNNDDENDSFKKIFFAETINGERGRIALYKTNNNENNKYFVMVSDGENPMEGGCISTDCICTQTYDEAIVACGILSEAAKKEFKEKHQQANIFEVPGMYAYDGVTDEDELPSNTIMSPKGIQANINTARIEPIMGELYRMPVTIPIKTDDCQAPCFVIVKSTYESRLLPYNDSDSSYDMRVLRLSHEESARKLFDALVNEIVEDVNASDYYDVDSFEKLTGKETDKYQELFRFCATDGTDGWIMLFRTQTNDDSARDYYLQSMFANIATMEFCYDGMTYDITPMVEICGNSIAKAVFGVNRMANNCYEQLKSQCQEGILEIGEPIRLKWYDNIKDTDDLPWQSIDIYGRTIAFVQTVRIEEINDDFLSSIGGGNE